MINNLVESNVLVPHAYAITTSGVIWYMNDKKGKRI